MTISYCVQVGDPLAQSEIVTVERIILSTFSEIHQTYNNWNPDSEISKLNRLPAYQTTSLSDELAHFLHYVHTLVELTERRFDPTVKPLYQLWKQKMQLGSIPTDEEIALFSKAVGWDKIHLEGNIFWKECEHTEIDFGGVAKGYAVDLLSERLQAAGFKNIYVEWGGEIRTVGYHPEGRKWKIALSKWPPLELHNQSIATSGNYLQKWSINGVTYTHVIDPYTKQPLRVTDKSIEEVHVIANSCAEADAVATALMLFSLHQEARDWAQSKGIKALI